MGTPSIRSSRAITARPLASWPVTTLRTCIACLLLVRLVHGHVCEPVPGLSGTRNGLDSLQRGSSAYGRNGRDPAVDQEVCPDDVRRIVRREVNCQLRDFQRIGDPLAWIVGSEDALDRLSLLFAWDASEHRRVRRAWALGIHANSAVHELGAEDSSQMADCCLGG